MTPRSSSPLEEIERHVTSRATRSTLDVDASGGEGELRALIDQVIDEWSDDHRRGQRDHALSDPTGLAERAFRNLARYGPLTDLLEDAASSHRKLDPTEGLQDAQLDDGARVHIVHGDLSRGNHLMLNIRKFTGVAIGTLDQLVARGTASPTAARFLTAAVRSRLSIVFAGAPGAGKTTLMSCCAAELDPSLRVVIAEEVFEADVPLANVASMQTRPGRSDRPEVDLRRLVAGFLRMAPDVAIVGEVRDREALPLLLTLSSGVTGYTTIHAGSARQALTRLRFVAQLSEAAAQLPVAALNNLVTEAVDLVVHSERGPDGPRVTSITAVEDLTAGPDAVQFTTTELFHRPRLDSDLVPTGLLPLRATERLERHGHDVRALLGTHDLPDSLR